MRRRSRRRRKIVILIRSESPLPPGAPSPPPPRNAGNGKRKGVGRRPKVIIELFLVMSPSPSPQWPECPWHCSGRFLTGNGSTVGCWRLSLNSTVLQNTTQHYSTGLPGSAWKVRRPIFLGSFFGEAGGKKEKEEKKWRWTVGGGGERWMSEGIIVSRPTGQTVWPLDRQFLASLISPTSLSPAEYGTSLGLIVRPLIMARPLIGS